MLLLQDSPGKRRSVNTGCFIHEDFEDQGGGGVSLSEEPSGRLWRWQITIEEGEQRAKELSVMFIETSAKTGYNVKQGNAEQGARF
ncbi:hypothetical protein CRUP_031855 [Coryphaenoides rupestris]|nr:hypothetical protein CRUP_031855 [Coryphaenoides rupestris]